MVIKRRGSKGQAISADFMFAMIIMLIVIGAAASSWDRVMYLIRQKTQRTELRRLGLAVSDVLVRSPGTPSDWNSSSVLSIGLVDEHNVLNKGKIQEFVGMPESEIQSKLRIEGYGFSFRVRATNGTTIASHGSAPSSITNAVTVRRIAVYDTIPVHVEFGLWVK